jgi:hypothetical protein
VGSHRQSPQLSRQFPQKRNDVRRASRSYWCG